MARPTKQGFDYFPLDVGFFSNKKISALRRAFGSLGILTYVNLLCRVYEQGFAYHFEDEDSLVADIAEDIGNGHLRQTMIQIREIIHYLIRHQMLSERLFQQSWISSVQMQEQFLTMSTTAKRKCVAIPDPLNLVGVSESIPTVGVNSEETPINSEETPVNSEFSTQSIVKYSKVKYSTLLDTPEGASVESESESKESALTLPMAGGKTFVIDDDRLNEWMLSYPFVDITGEIKKMQGWFDNHPMCRYSRVNLLTFVDNWLSKTRIDRGRVTPQQAQTGSFDTEEFYRDAVARTFGDETTN